MLAKKEITGEKRGKKKLVLEQNRLKVFNGGTFIVTIKMLLYRFYCHLYSDLRTKKHVRILPQTCLCGFFLYKVSIISHLDVSYGFFLRITMLNTF